MRTSIRNTRPGKIAPPTDILAPAIALVIMVVVFVAKWSAIVIIFKALT